jgi:hypothetical protein
MIKKYKKVGGLNIKTKRVIWFPPELEKEIARRAKAMGVAKWVWVDCFIKSNE